MTQATKTAQAIATVTLKSTGLVYTLYPVSSRTSDTTYAVWTINGKPVHCTCKDRKYRPYKMCDHMKQWLSENSQVVEAPVCSELKTVFGSVKEELEYKLGAYGAKVAYGWAYEQKYAQAQAAQAEEDARFKAEKEARDAEAYEKRVAFLASQELATAGTLNNANRGFNLYR